MWLELHGTLTLKVELGGRQLVPQLEELTDGLGVMQRRGRCCGRRNKPLVVC